MAFVKTEPFTVKTNTENECKHCIRCVTILHRGEDQIEVYTMYGEDKHGNQGTTSVTFNAHSDVFSTTSGFKVKQRMINTNMAYRTKKKAKEIHEKIYSELQEAGFEWEPADSYSDHEESDDESDDEDMN